jgi:hypothetical protein
MKTTFTFVKANGSDALAKQARAILNIVEAKAEISKDDLLDQIQLDVKSKQKAERLLSYYKGQLISEGYMEERKHG